MAGVVIGQAPERLQPRERRRDLGGEPAGPLEVLHHEIDHAAVRLGFQAHGEQQRPRVVKGGVVRAAHRVVRQPEAEERVGGAQRVVFTDGGSE